MTWAGKGSTRKYRKKRAACLERDNHRCQLAYAGYCTGRATTAHHTIPWEGDPGDIPLQYLIAACFPCNHHAGQPTNPDPEPKPWNP